MVSTNFVLDFLKNKTPNLTKSSSDEYNASCPVCREGSSFLKRKRFFINTSKKLAKCHNCGGNWNYFSLLKLLNLPTNELLKHALSYKLEYEEVINIEDAPEKPLYIPSDLELVDDRNDMLTTRLLNVAKYRPKNYFISKTDFFFNDRLIIPSYDFNREMDYYSARATLEGQVPKYLNAFGKKKIFNLEKVDINFPYIFIFEGAIDAMFVKNGVAIYGLTLTKKQLESINTYFPNHRLVHCFDNPYLDKKPEVVSAKNAAIQKNGKNDLYYTYKNLRGYKDINEYVVSKEISIKEVEIDTNLILEEAISGFLYNVRYG